MYQMSRLTILLLLFVILTINSSIAQKQNFEQGTLYLTNGQTIEGFIELNTLEKMGRRVLFQKSTAANVETYLPNQLAGFLYQSTDTHFRSITFNYYKDDGVTREKTNKVSRFAKVLVTGEVDLLKVPLTQFEYNQEAFGSKNYLYLIQKGTEYIQVDVLQTKSSGNQIVVGNKYKGVLTYALNECDKINQLAERTAFTDKSITDLIEKYHECIGSTAQIKIAKESQPNIAAHFFRAGYLKVRDDFYEEELGFTLGYQFTFKMPELSRNLGFSLAADYVYQQYYWNDFVFFRGDYKESDIRLNLALDIYLLQREKLKIRMSPGYSYYLMIAQDPDVNKRGVGNYQLFGLELAIQYQAFGLFLQTAGQGGNVARPDGMLNIGGFYQFK